MREDVIVMYKWDNGCYNCSEFPVLWEGMVLMNGTEATVLSHYQKEEYNPYSVISIIV